MTDDKKVLIVEDKLDEARRLYKVVNIRYGVREDDIVVLQDSDLSVLREEVKRIDSDLGLEVVIVGYLSGEYQEIIEQIRGDVPCAVYDDSLENRVEPDDYEVIRNPNDFPERLEEKLKGFK